jgi:hypothetical protein
MADRRSRSLKDLIDLTVLPDNSVPVPLLVGEVVKTEKAKSSKVAEVEAAGPAIRSVMASALVV